MKEFLICEHKTQGKKRRSMFLQKAVLWPEACVIVRIGSREQQRYRRPCIRICTCQITKTEIATERPAKFSYMQNRFGRRADKWQVSQSFWRVFVESKTRISDRMTKIVWPRVSKAYSLWGIKHIGRSAAKIVRNLFRQIFDAKNLNAPPVKSMPPTGLADDSQSGNASDSVVGCRMLRNLFDGFRW